MKRPRIIFQIYRENSGGFDAFRWRALARNGKIVAESGEAYASKTKLRKELSLIIDAIQAVDFDYDDKTEDKAKGK